MKKVLSIAIAILVLSLSVLPAFAADIKSPKAPTAYYIIFIDSDAEGGRAVAEYKSGVGEDGKQTVVIKGIPDDGYTFTGWAIDGEYVSNGKLTDAELELIVSSDLKVKPQFTKVGGTDTTKPASGNTTKVVDNGSKSPQTGSNDAAAYAVFFVSAAALVAVVTIAKRRSAEK